MTSDTAKNIYKEVSNIGIPLIAASTGNPLCQCKISLPTQVYMLVYEYLGYRR